MRLKRNLNTNIEINLEKKAKDKNSIKKENKRHNLIKESLYNKKIQNSELSRRQSEVDKLNSRLKKKNEHVNIEVLVLLE